MPQLLHLLSGLAAAATEPARATTAEARAPRGPVRCNKSSLLQREARAPNEKQSLLTTTRETHIEQQRYGRAKNKQII